VSALDNGPVGDQDSPGPLYGRQRVNDAPCGQVLLMVLFLGAVAAVLLVAAVVTLVDMVHAGHSPGSGRERADQSRGSWDRTLNP
jgi:hypothetical protein